MIEFLQLLPQTIYCERSLHGHTWSEPWNAVSNIIYILVALLIFWQVRKLKLSDKFLIFPLLIVAIGVGSLDYHTFRNPVTLLLDAGPIYVLMLLVAYHFLQKFYDSKLKISVVMVLFLMVQINIYIVFTGTIATMLSHVVVILMLAIFFAIKYQGMFQLEKISILALYLMAILSRQLDTLSCEFIEVGSHFLWHVFSALMLYFLIRLLTRIEIIPQYTQPHA